MGEKRAGEIEDLVKKIKKEFEPELVLLFGSRAREDHLKSSDYDIIVVSKKFRGVNFLKRLEMAYEIWDGDVMVDILCYTPEEFEKKRDQICIVKKAVEEGIAL